VISMSEARRGLELEGLASIANFIHRDLTH
jgi:hypothetical protein